MGGDLIEGLSWLPEPGADIRARMNALARGRETPAGACAELRGLAGYRLDGNQLARLARALDGLIEVGADLTALTPLSLAIVSNGLTDLIVPALRASALRHGLLLSVVDTPFGQAEQQLLDPDSALNRARPDAVLIALDQRALLPHPAKGSERLDAALGRLDLLHKAVHETAGAATVFQTMLPHTGNLLGSLDALLPGTWNHGIAALNDHLRDLAQGGQALIFDLNSLAAAIGWERWHDPVQWNLAKLPFAPCFLPHYAEWLARLLGAVRGKSRRCLVVDLDNTLWGGVIGDDGLADIILGQGSALGEAYVEFQRTLLALRQRGIVLCVSSKNDDATARLPFREHPDMVLAEDDFAVFQANWDDKASNVKAIADTLGFGVESLVFFDDNPVERARVRRALPGIAVPEVPDDPAFFARSLLAAGYFEAVAFSSEDAARSDYYTAIAWRVAVREPSGDLDAFLDSLQMEAIIRPFDATARARIAQLINKSNQFNLATRRYTEAQVRDMEGDTGKFTMQVRLQDAFGDNGIISVIICNRGSEAWEIDTWLMSCRVLGRGVERLVRDELVRNAREAGAAELLGHYRPTPRNGLVSDHYENLGFTLTEDRGGDGTLWHLDLRRAKPLGHHIRLRDPHEPTAPPAGRGL